MSYKIAKTIAETIEALEAVEKEHSTLAQELHNSLQQAGWHASIAKQANRYRGLLAGVWQRSIKDLDQVQAHIPDDAPQIAQIIKEVKACKQEAKVRRRREKHLALFGLEARARLTDKRKAI